MPNEFQFLDRETREPQKLPDVDDRICEYLGIAPDPKRFSYWYDIVVLTGMSFLSKEKESSELTEATLLECLEARTDLDDSDRELFKKFLGTDYIFTAWWSPK